MNKEEFKKFKRLSQERDYLESRIRSLEKRLGAVPIVKDKVQASEKEYPYLTVHQVVDAPEPRKAHRIRRELDYFRRLLENNERLTDELVGYLEKIEDARTRQIMAMRFMEGKKISEIEAKVYLTERHIHRIIDEAVEKF